MTQPDDDWAFQESVRQRLTEYSPPFDPDNWQRMRRKIRRKQWWRVLGMLTGSLIVVALMWYTVWLKSVPSGSVPPRLVHTQPAPAKALAQAMPAFPGVAKVQYHERLQGPQRITKPEALSTNVVSLIAPLQPRPIRPVFTATLSRSVSLPNLTEAEIIRQVTTGEIGADSTTYRVLSRNLKRWSNVVIVCDFTSSMYPYSTQLMSWFKKNSTNRQVQGLVFFTDCDSLGRETGPGRAGQLFATASHRIEHVLPLMLASARNTVGNQESAENNIEALLYAQAQFPDASHLVLIADNSSSVKDMARLAELQKPVHIILCGSTYDSTRAFQPDYYALARQSGGSLHTLEDDLTQLAELKTNTWIRVDGRYYRLNRRGRFVVSRFRHRPKRLLGLFWY